MSPGDRKLSLPVRCPWLESTGPLTTMGTLVGPAKHVSTCQRLPYRRAVRPWTVTWMMRLVLLVNQEAVARRTACGG